MAGERMSAEQRNMLAIAAEAGNPFTRERAGAYRALGGVRSKTGGARRRMMERLIAAGLLEKDWPWKITTAGRAALQET